MSKLAKFRNSPERFFADSKHGWLRAVGRVVAPPIAGNELLMDVLENPLDALAQSDLSVVARVARRAQRRRARHRRALLERAGRPTVSVVMAARNAASTVERAIRSLLDQSYAELEIVVVDDASDDDTPAILEALALESDRVSWYENPEPRGAAHARNVGLSKTKGAYLTFQDADDLAHPERIERQLAALLEKDAVVCVCNVLRETPDGRRVVVNQRRYTKGVITMLFARDPVFERLGYMRELIVGEDSEYFERMRAVFGPSRAVHLFQTLYRARFSSGSLLFSSGSTSVDETHVTFVHSEDHQRALAEALEGVEEVRRRERSPFVPFAP